MKRTTILLAAAAMLAGAGAAAGSATGSGDPLACAIEVSRRSGMAMIEVTARSQSPVVGEYSFRLHGPGMNVSQGGPFEAAAGERVVLGAVSVSTGGGAYKAALKVSAAGRTASCEQGI